MGLRQEEQRLIRLKNLSGIWVKFSLQYNPFCDKINLL